MFLKLLKHSVYRVYTGIKKLASNPTQTCVKIVRFLKHSNSMQKLLKNYVKLALDSDDFQSDLLASRLLK